MPKRATELRGAMWQLLRLSSLVHASGLLVGGWAMAPLFADEAGRVARAMGLGALAGAAVVVVWFLRATRELRSLAVEASADDPAVLVAGRRLLALGSQLWVQAAVAWLLVGAIAELVLAVGGRHGGGRLALSCAALGVFSGALLGAVCRRRSFELVEQLFEGVPHALVEKDLASSGSNEALRHGLFAFVVVSVPAGLTAWVAHGLSSGILAGQTGGAWGLVLRVAALVLAFWGPALWASWTSDDLFRGGLRRLAGEATHLRDGGGRGLAVVVGTGEGLRLSLSYAGAFERTRVFLRGARRGSRGIAETSEVIGRTTERFESGIKTQATALNETSVTTDELARSARQVADSAQSVSELAQRTLGQAQDGQLTAQSFGSAVARMRQDNEAIVAAVARLSKRVQQIGKVVEFISSVADRSDLLALNAELEGTKAGDVGRGFTLVAAEMRRLAENVIESTNEIELLIEEIREATRGVVDATDSGMRATQAGLEQAEDVLHALQRILELAGRTSDSVRAISLATQQQKTGTDQLAEAMGDILRITEQNSTVSGQIASANAELRGIAQRIDSAVDGFETRT